MLTYVILNHFRMNEMGQIVERITCKNYISTGIVVTHMDTYPARILLFRLPRRHSRVLPGCRPARCTDGAFASSPLRMSRSKVPSQPRRSTP